MGHEWLNIPLELYNNFSIYSPNGDSRAGQVPVPSWYEVWVATICDQADCVSQVLTVSSYSRTFVSDSLS